MANTKTNKLLDSKFHTLFTVNTTDFQGAVWEAPSNKAGIGFVNIETTCHVFVVNLNGEALNADDLAFNMKDFLKQGCPEDILELGDDEGSGVLPIMTFGIHESSEDEVSENLEAIVSLNLVDADDFGELEAITEDLESVYFQIQNN